MESTVAYLFAVNAALPVKLQVSRDGDRPAVRHGKTPMARSLFRLPCRAIGGDSGRRDRLRGATPRLNCHLAVLATPQGSHRGPHDAAIRYPALGPSVAKSVPLFASCAPRHHLPSDRPSVPIASFAGIRSLSSQLPAFGRVPLVFDTLRIWAFFTAGLSTNVLPVYRLHAGRTQKVCLWLTEIGLKQLSWQSRTTLPSCRNLLKR